VEEKKSTMTAHNDDTESALEAFLSGPSLDPESINDPPPLKDGDEDSLLTRERVSFDVDE
jgi:hypothetical protein